MEDGGKITHGLTLSSRTGPDHHLQQQQQQPTDARTPPGQNPPPTARRADEPLPGVHGPWTQEARVLVITNPHGSGEERLFASHRSAVTPGRISSNGRCGQIIRSTSSGAPLSISPRRLLVRGKRQRNTVPTSPLCVCACVNVCVCASASEAPVLPGPRRALHHWQQLPSVLF